MKTAFSEGTKKERTHSVNTHPRRAHSRVTVQNCTRDDESATDRLSEPLHFTGLVGETGEHRGDAVSQVNLI